MNTDQFFDALWQDYLYLAPQAQIIHDLFARESRVVNDHVAFRTFAQTPVELNRLEPLLLALGYQVQGQYRFEQKKLRARSYIHPQSGVPKIFLSELLVNELSEGAQAILAAYTEQISDAVLDSTVFYSGRAWAMPTWAQYQALLAESEYAAWLLAIGLRANHFTISVNHLENYRTLQQVVQAVKEAGFALNTVGGEIKGSSEVFLEQASTLADKQQVEFADGDEHLIATCFYEFALRYPQSDGALFQGFVEGNADKIFDSTNSR